MRLIDADWLLSFIRLDEKVIAPEQHTAQDIIMMVQTAPTIEPPPNDPLTLEELREMDGEPVWVEVSENWSKSGSKSGWYLVRFHKNDDRLRIYIYNTRSGATFVPEQDYVQSWLAYRRKPEEG